MITTWGKGEGRKVPYRAIAIPKRKTEERVGGGRGAQPRAIQRDRGINNTSALRIPVVAWGN